MRIGVDVRLVYHRMAGIGWYAVRLLSALAKNDHENDYILLQHRRQSAALITAPRFTRATLYTPVHYRFEQWPLSIETRFHNLDIIHSPDFICPLYNKIPAVITVHDLAFLLYPNFVTARSARYYGQVEEAVKHASRIIAVSRSTKNDLIKLLGASESKIDVIYEASDPFFRPIPREHAQMGIREVGIQAPERFILFVGTIEPRKNLSTLIRAYRHLRDYYHHALPLLLAGAPGWLAEDVHGLVAELGLEQHVHFLGKTSNDQLLALYNLATVLAHPAHYEGFGLPPLEAMACATPVVCSNAGSLPEVVGDAALLVPPEDVEAWSVALDRIISDDQLQATLGKKGLKRATIFSWDKAARETMSVYHKAVA